MTAWAVAAVGAKFALYLCAAAGIGGCFGLGLMAYRGGVSPVRSLPGASIAIVCSGLGLPLSAAYFFIRVGEFAEAGLPGMMEPVFVQILWDSPVGVALQLRLAGLFMLVTALAGLAVSGAGQRKNWFEAAALLAGFCGALLTAASFSITGHSATLGWLASLAITVHVLAALAWAGSLFVLFPATRQLGPAALQEVLHRYGVLAAALVALLLVAGAILLVLLYISSTADVSLVYIATLAGKLLLVTGLLLIAAHHKWRAVPRVVQTGGVASFRRSLALEMLVAISILAVTACLSTAMGPFHDS